MGKHLQLLNEVWLQDPNKGDVSKPSEITFDDLTNSIVSTGPFYYYVIDFSNMSVTNVNPSIADILGFDPTTVALADIMDAIHPDDMSFVLRAERFCAEYYFNNISVDKLMKYKTSFNFRMRLKDGTYALFNHQAIMLVLGKDGGYGKALNIHTRIDHLSDANTYRYSLIGLNGEPSFLNLVVDEAFTKKSLSPKEIEVIRCMADGLDSNEIGKKLFISPLTVKKHRANILTKTDCKNTAQLIKISILQGLI